MKTDFFEDIERLRGFACILVLIQHLAWICPLRYTYEIIPQYLLNGTGGVRLFFAISGFVVTLSLRDKLNLMRDGTFLDRLFSAKDLLFSFYKKRFYRIFPVVFFVLIALGIFLGFTEDDSAWGIIFLRTPAEIFFGVYNSAMELFCGTERIHFCGPGPFWTLAVEAQFYIFWPLILLACKNDNARAVVSLTLGLLFMYLILPVLRAQYGFRYYYTYNNLAELFLGSFLAFLYRGKAPAAESKLLKLTAATLALLVWFYPNASDSEFYSATVVSSASVLLVALAVFARESFKIPLLCKIFNFLGNRSFSFYTVQLTIANIVVYYTNSIYFSKEAFSEYEFYRCQFLIFIVALFVVTELVYRFIEKPFRKIGREEAVGRA